MGEASALIDSLKSKTSQNDQMEKAGQPPRIGEAAVQLHNQRNIPNTTGMLAIRNMHKRQRMRLV